MSGSRNLQWSAINVNYKLSTARLYLYSHYGNGVLAIFTAWKVKNAQKTHCSTFIDGNHVSVWGIPINYADICAEPLLLKVFIVLGIYIFRTDSTPRLIPLRQDDRMLSSSSHPFLLLPNGHFRGLFYTLLVLSSLI